MKEIPLQNRAGEAEDEVDHRNLDKLDCRKSNLRVCRRQGNNSNRPARTPDKYKGVRPYKKKFQARITVDRKSIHLGLYNTEEDAARAYDQEAIRRFGEFARTNFPLEEYYEAA